ncbi:heparinase II/III family protein [uncultured Alsobacter sp.]|uniref:heparinase II/III domain-containing protein n=1 Tax=uncultured Alsobacter sp. TaxID=1748258 RepID=UPI0025D3138E|nr:heparinase II/III family protein [uncultured Alsobacter sp.]
MTEEPARGFPLHRRTVLSGLAASAIAPAAARAQPLALPPDPRLLVTAADWRQLEIRRAADPDLALLVTRLLERARKDLALPPLERKLEGRRLLGVSREFIRRVLLWSFARRLTGDQVYLERARREMLQVAGFADWNPAHFLDVAEMTTGMAIGYDWLRREIPTDERALVRRAIVDKGIAQVRNGHPTFRMKNNWGQVCIGGMVLGALAVGDEEPELAAAVLAAGKAEAFTALAAYKPDGVYPEGPSYWVYGTSYETLLVAALRSALATDWGLMGAPGLARSAAFYAHAIGPTGRSFNFADGGEGQELATPLFYLARALNVPTLIAAKRAMIRQNQGLGERFAPLAALWWPGEAEAGEPARHFFGQGPQPVAIWRSAWNDPKALYFAIKGGGANHNHGHMDAGSFVLDLDGIRWAVDLGMQDYNSLESRGIDLWSMKQTSPRWQVFRLGSAAHNTLTIGGSLHNAAGMASLDARGEDGAVIDLTPVFLPGQVQRASRAVRIDGRAVRLRDEISGARPGAAIRWALTTRAAITLEDRTAVLRQDGQVLRVRFEGAPVVLGAPDISAPRSEFDAPNPGARQLLATAPADAAGSWSLAVTLEGG